MFNMAVLKQKGVEILYALQPEKRTSAELNIALEYLQASTTLFEQLANDPTKPTPYPAEVPRQRRSYGQSLEKRFEAALAAQTEYEQTEQGKIEQARRLREAEQKRRDELEAQRLAQIQRQAEALAEQRRRMREEAEQWTAMSKAWADSDDEDGDGKKKRGGGGGGGKKRKSTKMKGAGDDGFETAESTDDGGGADRPAKKKRMKKVSSCPGPTLRRLFVADPKDLNAQERKAKKGRKSKATSGDESRKMDVDEQYDEEDGDQVRLKVPKKRGKASGQIKSACVFPSFFLCLNVLEADQTLGCRQRVYRLGRGRLNGREALYRLRSRCNAFARIPPPARLSREPLHTEHPLGCLAE